SPTRSLARRCAGSLRFHLRKSYGGRAEAPWREGGRVARFAALARSLDWGSRPSGSPTRALARVARFAVTVPRLSIADNAGMRRLSISSFAILLLGSIVDARSSTRIRIMPPDRGTLAVGQRFDLRVEATSDGAEPPHGLVVTVNGVDITRRNMLD